MQSCLAPKWNDFENFMKFCSPFHKTDVGARTGIFNAVVKGSLGYNRYVQIVLARFFWRDCFGEIFWARSFWQDLWDKMVGSYNVFYSFWIGILNRKWSCWLPFIVETDDSALLIVRFSWTSVLHNLKSALTFINCPQFNILIPRCIIEARICLDT